MKNLSIKLMLFSISFILISGTTVLAQEKTETIVIRTSTVCEMCKETIEKNLSFEKGVKSVEVDFKKKIVTVIYRTDKTTPEKIKAAIVKLGYRADETEGNPKAFKKLPACCKDEGCGKD